MDGAWHAGALQLILLLPLAYVSHCVHRSLFTSERVFGSYSLVGEVAALDAETLEQERGCGAARCRGWFRVVGLSDSCSLLLNGMFQCRLQFALASNFLLTLHLPENAVKATAFAQFYGRGSDVVPVLGQNGLTIYAPLAMLLVAAGALLLSVRRGHWRGCCRRRGPLRAAGTRAPERARRVANGVKLLELKLRDAKSRERAAYADYDSGGGGSSSWRSKKSNPLGFTFGGSKAVKGLEMHSVKLLQSSREDPNALL